MESRQSHDLSIFNKNLIKISDKSSLSKKIHKFSNTFVVEHTLKNPDLDYTYLIKILKDYGLKQSKDPNDNHLFGIISYKFYNTNFYLLNEFQFIDSIENKFSLYLNLKLYFPEFFKKTYPDSFNLQLHHQWDKIKKKIYIARPIEGMAGKDISIIYDHATFEDAKKKLLNPQYSGVSLTEYVQNPLLINGKKLHLRAYFLITLINNVFNSYLLDLGAIIIAKENYKNDDWNNKDIHDTHFSNTRIGLYFPNDLYGNTNANINNDKDFEIIYKNMKESLKYITKIAFNNIYQYETAINTWEIYGVDFMVRDDLSVFVIEINARFVGYGSFGEIEKSRKINTNKIYFDWINETVIKPCIFPNLNIVKNRSTDPIFTSKVINY
jgi:hypothetical protein